MRLLGILMAVWFAVGLAFAAPTGGTTTTAPADQGTYAGTAATITGIAGGHIYEVNVDWKRSTLYWAGLYGSITESVVLEDSLGNTFYTWTVPSLTAQWVYFTVDAITDWNSAFFSGAVTDADLNAEIWMDATLPTVETVTATFPTTDTNGAVCGTTPYTPTTTDPVRYTRTLDNANNPTWLTCLYEYNNGTIYTVLFKGEVNAVGGTAYDGTTVNYQVLVAADDDTPTAFYVYVE